MKTQLISKVTAGQAKWAINQPKDGSFQCAALTAHAKLKNNPDKTGAWVDKRCTDKKKGRDVICQYQP